jgi:hypothetical protein
MARLKSCPVTKRFGSEFSASCKAEVGEEQLGGMAEAVPLQEHSVTSDVIQRTGDGDCCGSGFRHA